MPLVTTLRNKDIKVSPWHRLYIDDVLVRANDLANNLIVVADNTLGRSSYYHIVLN
ncbi:hypothetical protein GCM10027565_28130 [Bordetella tumulicola]